MIYKAFIGLLIGFLLSLTSDLVEYGFTEKAVFFTFGSFVIALAISMLGTLLVKPATAKDEQLTFQRMFWQNNPRPRGASRVFDYLIALAIIGAFVYFYGPLQAGIYLLGGIGFLLMGFCLYDLLRKTTRKQASDDEEKT